MKEPIEFCQDGMRCAQCPFRLLHDEAARLAVSETVARVAEDTRPESYARFSRLVKAQQALKGVGITRPDSRQANAVANAAQYIAADNTCSSYDTKGVRALLEKGRGES